MEINHWTIFTKSNIARIVKAVPPSHKWMREKLNVSGLKSQVRIKWKRLLLSRKVELICKNYVWIARKISFSELANNASQQVSALLCNWNHAMISNGESLFRPKMCLCCCWFVTFVAIFTLGTQHLYWPWEALTIAKWKACVSGFANKTHIALASAIKYNITVYVCSWECQYKH